MPPEARSGEARMTLMRSQIRLLVDFLKNDLKKILLLTLIASMVCIVIGFILGLCLSDWSLDLMKSFSNNVKQTGVKLPDGSVSVTALMSHNWLVTLQMAGSGLVPFLFIPIAYLISNNVLIGAAAAIYVHFDLSPILFLAGIIPHGIFEIPALILSLSCGFYLCLNLCRIILGSVNRIPFSEMLTNVLRAMLLLNAPLLVLAAIFETYITPLVQALFQ